MTPGTISAAMVSVAADADDGNGFRCGSRTRMGRRAVTETSFTPGPWRLQTFEAANGERPQYIVQKEKPYTGVLNMGAFSKPSTKEAMANARLINEAPALYEALVIARGYVAKVHASIAGAVGQDNIVKPDLDRIDAALVKARGETP